MIQAKSPTISAENHVRYMKKASQFFCDLFGVYF